MFPSFTRTLAILSFILIVGCAKTKPSGSAPIPHVASESIVGSQDRLVVEETSVEPVVPGESPIVDPFAPPPSSPESVADAEATPNPVPAAGAAAAEPAEAKRFSVPLNVLQAVLADATSCLSEWGQGVHSLRCNSAAARYCRGTQKYDGGVIQEFSTSTARATVTCFNGKYMAASLVELQIKLGVDGVCFGGWNAQHSLDCNIAAGKLCVAEGFTGGAIQEYNPAGAKVACFKGRRVTLPMTSLGGTMGGIPAGYHIWDERHSLTYNSAAKRLCVAFNGSYQGGVIQNWDPETKKAGFACIK